MRDESVTFSLRELEKLESERLEKVRREELAAVERAEREEAEARRREADALAAKEEARRLARLEEIELEARREAQARAAVEQTRIEVEARTRAQESDAERRHELELARMRRESEKKTPFGLIVGSAAAGAALAVAACLAAYFGATRPAIDRSMASLENVAARANEHAQTLENEQAADRKKLAGLEADLRDTKQTIATLQANKPVAPKDPPKGTFVPVPKDPIKRTDFSAIDACKNNPDPMCGIGKH